MLATAISSEVGCAGNNYGHLKKLKGAWVKYQTKIELKADSVSGKSERCYKCGNHIAIKFNVDSVHEFAHC